MTRFDTVVALAKSFAKEMLRKSGVREWESPDMHDAIAYVSWRMADQIVCLAEEEQGTYTMVAKLLVQAMDGTPPQISFADHAGDFGPTAANNLEVGTPTDCQFAAASLANGSYRQSAKVDLGENRADEYFVRMCVEIAATPTAGNAITLWWAPSGSATAGTANGGGVSGSDSAYTGYSSNAAASVLQLHLIGSGTVTAQATTTNQVMAVGRFRPTERYGSLVLLNGSGAAFHSDDAEIHVVFDPIIPEQQ